MSFNLFSICRWSFISLILFSQCQLIRPQKIAKIKQAVVSYPFQFQQLKTDSLFNSPQVISIVRLTKKDSAAYYFDLAHHPSQLMKTSQFAKQKKAIIAINGGFFDMDNGGSATYLEAQDSVFHRHKLGGEKWAIANWAKTGAIIVDKKGQLKITPAQSQTFYEQSLAEESVLITGPLLIKKGAIVKLMDTEFVTKRHPRTCLCETTTAFLMLTIDGRKHFAKGMSLLELQTFLAQQNCINAINLDGGGSTTMWVKEQGIVNTPSAPFGERKVANALVVKLANSL